MKMAALLAGGGMSGLLPAAIQQALAIDPPEGSTYLDAEHVVILMQENRSFDHCYGTLRGVRGYNDPRALTLPNGNPVWLQTNAKGQTYAPFRLNIRDTKATWMGSLPHSWVDQTDARNSGKHDRWLIAKPSGHKAYASMPLTMGYYNREDIPFYYALADAFTVCDQNFCSSLTGTTPNRLYLWTGTIRANPTAKANVRNEDIDYGREATWGTFPERLEDAGISWKIYQNELSLDTGLDGEAESWLSNFTDNPLEWFTQYHVRYIHYRRQLASQEKAWSSQLDALKAKPQPWDDALKKQINDLQAQLNKLRQDRGTWNEANFKKLPLREQNLHRKAFAINDADPHYRELETVDYTEDGVARRMAIPKGDVLHQFRQDVEAGQLPTVSWLVAPEKFSDHPGAPWYGAWYLSESISILASKPELWKKTIFILCYDENDGYFDHQPPFVPPLPGRPDTGQVSAGIDTACEHVTLEQEREYQRQNPGASGRSGPIGLGFRVPLVIASPWSRGGRVCSQVFDHTSILQFLEVFLSHKTGKTVREPNISQWRRTVCGDLTSVFQPHNGEKADAPKPVEKLPFFESIHQAQFRPAPGGYRALKSEEIADARKNPAAPCLPRQEPGSRPSCPLPYELVVDGVLDAERKAFAIHFAAGKELFGPRAAGAPFHVCASVKTKARATGRLGAESVETEIGRSWDYAVAPGDRLVGEWPFADFEGGVCHLRVHGPNGFYREFRATALEPVVAVTVRQAGATEKLILKCENRSPQKQLSLRVEDMAYGASPKTMELGPIGSEHTEGRLELDLAASHGWYDLRVTLVGVSQFEQRFAGHLETGRESVSDPRLG